MQPLLAALLLLVPEAREQVRRGAGQHPDPVVRHVSGLLAGDPRRVGFVSVVPLFVSNPAAARSRNAAWIRGGHPAAEVSNQGRRLLRIPARGGRLLVPAGAVFVAGRREFSVPRDVAAGPGSALVRVRARAASSPRGSGVRYAGCLPPELVADLLRARPGAPAWPTPGWARTLGAATFVAARDEQTVRTLRVALERACRPLTRARSRSVVGAVFQIGGRPVVAHVFGSHPLFVAALPDLLTGLAIQARREQYALPSTRGAVYAELRRRSLRAGRGRALAFLRAGLRATPRWNETAGGGRTMLARVHGARAIGHAVTDGAHVLLHYGLYTFRRPATAGGGGPSSGDEPAPPAPGGPTENDRAARGSGVRPTLAEERERARKAAMGVGRNR